MSTTTETTTNVSGPPPVSLLSSSSIDNIAFELSSDFDGQCSVESSSSSDSGWVAVKPIQDTNRRKELMNIVSLSVEYEKIIIVTREHSRLVTDTESTNRQWYGMFTAERFHAIHEQICQIDPSLDTLYPTELRPIKGYLYTYFSTNLASRYQKQSKGVSNKIDLQDNDICNAINFYLKNAYVSLGLNLYIDIIFNDLKTNEYFEIYSELNVRRIQTEIEKVRSSLYALLNKQQQLHSDTPPPTSLSQKSKMNQSSLMSMSRLGRSGITASSIFPVEISKEEETRFLRMNIKLLLDLYRNEDAIAFDLVKLYAEYYNNLLKPLVDARELTRQELTKFERKVQNQEKTNKFMRSQTAVEALQQLREQLAQVRSDMNGLSNDIDSITSEYKEHLVDLYSKLLSKMNARDKFKFTQSARNGLYPLFFEFLTKERCERLEGEIRDKKMQMLNAQVSLLEREKENVAEGERSRELTLKLVKLKLLVCNEEENMLRFQLDRFKQEKMSAQTTAASLKYYGLKELVNELGGEFLSEIKEKYKLSCFELVVGFLENKSKAEIDKILAEYEHATHQDAMKSDDDDDESSFYDAYENTEAIMEEEAREKQTLLNEMAQIKKKILAVSSKKSSLRLIQVIFWIFVIQKR